LIRRGWGCLNASFVLGLLLFGRGSLARLAVARIRA
jgi:hypothetical protein